MTDTNPEPFVPYRERPPLDKGEIITWRELESGMLFEPGVLSDPRRRRVRGTPIPNGSIVRLDGEPFRSDAIPAHVTFHFPVETAQLMRVPDGADEHRSEV
jgi:hypothetical protein